MHTPQEFQLAIAARRLNEAHAHRATLTDRREIRDWNRTVRASQRRQETARRAYLIATHTTQEDAA